VWGTLLAILVLAVGVQGLQLSTGVLWVDSMFNGLALIVAVGLAVGRDRRVTKGDKTAPPPGEKTTGEVTEQLDRLEPETQPHGESGYGRHQE
jgi:ribose transport system permease protein